MRALILALDTEVPKTCVSQEEFSSVATRLLGIPNSKTRLLNRIVAGSQIKKRHVILADFLDDASQEMFFRRDDKGQLPGTGKRNQLYKKEAPKLAEAVCYKTLKQWGGDPKAITHVISVSCTGMIAPGIEFLLIKLLGLSRNVERLGINFMGCFGAFKGIAIAKALAMENANHRILVVCTELCSLHFQEDQNTDTMVANSIFADGAAAVIVGVEPRKGEKPLFEIHNQGSAALDDSLDDMTWEATDHGYQMRLSASVPTLLENNILPFARRIIGSTPSFNQCMWAVHPGGRSILESVAKACALQREQLSASWKVLNDYGNMSSPTFLFVLSEGLKCLCQKKWVVGLGFGPGLSIEGLLLKRVAENVAE
ncbi:hypothetical protein SCG7086_CW_00010 [Chlamydiales bacterium SCGC AG-110-P3]|nr:hypothetical protein SCG7086_CW_00010 [Chlamydiales bacterium SCGC AG-110-P3]